MRKPRILIEGGMYHVVARANRQEYILSSDEIKAMFLDVVKRAKRKYRFTLQNFCVMSNHFHFLMTPGKGENLSKIMQWILSVFALRLNKRFSWRGHVWYDRFKSRIVDGLREFVHAFCYIAENPIRAGIVRFPWEYGYNGVRYLRNLDFEIMEEPNPVLNLTAPLLCSPFLLT